MSFSILFKDELTGFYLSKVMIILWIGLPILTILLYLWQPDTGSEVPFTVIAAIVVSNIAGALAAIMLTVGIINERNLGVYELFMVRPIKKRNILFAKLSAVYLCITIAIIFAVALGLLIDYSINNGSLTLDMNSVAESLVISISMMAIASSAGILIGVASKSTLAGVVLVLFGANQISAISTIPTMMDIINPILVTASLSVLISGVLLLISIFIFERKQF